MKKYTWLIDKGHGGFINGEYVTAPKKLFQHSYEEIFYEGVWNRIIGDGLLRKLWSKGIHAIDLCPTELDVSLYTRANIANIYQARYGNCILLSLHSNAYDGIPNGVKDGSASGTEVHAYHKSIFSGKYADVFGQQYMDDFPAIQFRKASSTQIHRDSDFAILRETSCPALLMECLFYDHYEDYKKLIDPLFQERYINSLVSSIEKCEIVDV